jgi:prophage regulatory protein
LGPCGYWLCACRSLELTLPFGANPPTRWRFFRGGFFEPIRLFGTCSRQSNTTTPRQSGAGVLHTEGERHGRANHSHPVARRRVSEITGMERSALYERIQRGEIPKPIQIGSAAVSWIEAEVVAWVQQLIDASRHASTGEGFPPWPRLNRAAARRMTMPKHLTRPAPNSGCAGAVNRLRMPKHAARKP